MAALERLKTEKGQGELDKTTCCLGLSLGEYSALCFAGAISFKDGVMLTSIRGTAMQIAADAVASGMVSVVGLDKEAVIQLCDVASSAVPWELCLLWFHKSLRRSHENCQARLQG
eukprot:TRINITY_DN87926_c0_g1_i2.p1 TRINITY_DN87926_c0_g1~~TRINITY_DN87926_c0_g1_i2.p1  ORF type:complete len:115 (+),score=10.21 TRINITY_DN87926_c0_g1_i2:356-700(+)